MKITFILQAPLGTRGTPGTYLLLENLAKQCQVQVISPKLNKQEAIIVHNCTEIKSVFLDFDDIESAIMLSYSVMEKFSPDIIYMMNSDYNLNFIYKLKPLFEDTKWVVDVKTPSLVEGKRKRRRRFKSFLLQFYVEKIFTLSRDSVETWIPFLFRKTYIYPLGIQLSNFISKTYNHDPKRIKCKKFVFIGTLHKVRKIDFLIKAINQMSKNNYSTGIKFDFYGDGNAREELQQLANNLKLQDVVKFHGLIPQQKLNALLGNYDAGIAYVPNEKYEKSPSLKSLEYIAAGLPTMVSDTLGHREYLKYDLHFDFFENNIDSFCEVIKKMIVIGVNYKDIEKNLESIKQFDYEILAKKIILPELSTMLEK